MTALSEFQNSVKRVRDIANDITAQAAAALADATLRERHETIQCSCVVILVGYFESFIRNLAKEAVSTLCAASPPFASLDAKIRSTHFEHGGRILQSKASGKRKFSWILASQEDIARRLSSVAAPSYEIVWEAFANTNANPGVDVVQEFLGNFGIKKGWEKIAIENRVTSQWAQNSLDNIIVVRNECAHTGAVSVIPAPSTLIQYAKNIEDIAKAMCALVLAQIAAIAGVATPPATTPVATTSAPSVPTVSPLPATASAPSVPAVSALPPTASATPGSTLPAAPTPAAPPPPLAPTTSPSAPPVIPAPPSTPPTGKP